MEGRINRLGLGVGCWLLRGLGYSHGEEVTICPDQNWAFVDDFEARVPPFRSSHNNYVLLYAASLQYCLLTNHQIFKPFEYTMLCNKPTKRCVFPLPKFGRTEKNFYLWSADCFFCSISTTLVVVCATVGSRLVPVLPPRGFWRVILSMTELLNPSC